MYPGTATIKEITPKSTTTLRFKEKEDSEPGNDHASLVPSVNITETPQEYCIVTGVPGLRREDFSIEINQCVITIAAKKETEIVCSINDRCEYDYTDWTRAFALPDDADAVLAHASYKNGELIIRIPRGNTTENQAKAIVYVY